MKPFAEPTYLAKIPPDTTYYTQGVPNNCAGCKHFGFDKGKPKCGLYKSLRTGCITARLLRSRKEEGAVQDDRLATLEYYDRHNAGPNQRMGG